MNMRSDFSGNVVSIVTYNNQDIIREVIESILKYTAEIEYKIVIYAAFFRLSTLKSCVATLVIMVTMS